MLEESIMAKMGKKGDKPVKKGSKSGNAPEGKCPHCGAKMKGGKCSKCGRSY